MVGEVDELGAEKTLLLKQMQDEILLLERGFVLPEALCSPPAAQTGSKGHKDAWIEP